MKNLFKVSLVLASAVVLLTGCNCFSKMAKNHDSVQLICTPETLVLNNGNVDADIKVTFPADYYHQKAVLKVTPVMVFEGGEVAGTTQYFQGTQIEDNYTVIDSKLGGEYTMHVTFPYDERMACSELQLRAEIKCPNGKCKEFTLVNLNNGALPTAEEAAVLLAGGAEAEALKRQFGITIAQGVNTLQRELDFVAAMQIMSSEYQNVVTVETRASYMYEINSSTLSKSAANTEEIAAFQQNALAQSGDEHIKQNLYVKGYASPDGPEKFNDKLSAARSESGKKAAEKLLKEVGIELDAASYGEDWEGFAELVAASDMEDKDVILSVLRSYDSSTDREIQIKNMSQVYDTLKNDILPKLRRAQLINSSDISGKSDDEMAELVRAGKCNELNEKELLHIAASGKLTLSEQIVALEAAAKTYNGAAAYNNLGVAYAAAGEGAKAAQAFEKALAVGGKSSQLNNNLALVNLMNGDNEAAKSYVDGASAQTKALVAAAEGNYAQAQSQLNGFNAAIAATMNADYTAAKQAIANDKSAKADYLRAVIATKQGDFTTATTELKSAVAKDATYAERCKTDVNLRRYIGSEIQL